jgi:predicted ATPase
VTMRDARIRDYWRRTFRRVYPIKVQRFSFESLSSFSDGYITFSNGITVLVGGNGVGKSTLIAAIVEVLSKGSQAHGIDRYDRLSGSKINALVNVSQAERVIGMETNGSGDRISSGGPFEGSVSWLDPSAFSQSCVNQIRGDTNFADLLDPVSPAELSGEELEDISYLVGKRYSRCQMFEIGDYGGREVFPYFTVTVSDEIYSSESMGRGELSLLLSYWVLRNIPKCSILVLEEPETHVSPRSQEHLMNIVAKFCDQRAISVIAATHSPSIIRRVPPTNVRLVTRDAGTSMIIEKPSSMQVARILSGGVAYKGVFLVEDEGGKSFLSALLEEFADDLLPQFEVVVAGDESSISRSIEALPRTKDWLTLVGVYDGGMESRVNAEKFKWPHVFLPGNEAPENSLRKLANSGDGIQAELASSFQKSEADVKAALEFAAGLDLHEWIPRFAEMLGRESWLVRHALIRKWIGRNEDLSKKFVAEVRTKIDQIRS